LGLLLRARGYQTTEADSGEAALRLQQDFKADVVILDVVLPGMHGQEAFKRLRALDPRVICIFITAHGSIPSAVEAIRAGGYDYLPKPFDNDHLIFTVERALKQRGLVERVEELENDLSAREVFAGIVGRSVPVQQLIRHLAKAARADVPVLLSGESGTGKELAARSIHRASARSKGPFVVVNCGAIPPTLVEDELFGHERGAFTDAKAERKGRFEQAHHGTLLLDEIGDLALEAQVKLLRVLEDGECHRVGSERPIPIDVRVVAATNKDLRQEVAAGRFRDDLFWRLSVFSVQLPALRERLDDLPALVDHMLSRANAMCRTSIADVSPAVLARLGAYSWPGNIRQLANVIAHGAIVAESDTIEVSDLPEDLNDGGSRQPADSGTTLEATMAATERQIIEAVLARVHGNRTAAADTLGIGRRTLHTKLRRYQADDRDPPER